MLSVYKTVFRSIYIVILLGVSLNGFAIVLDSIPISSNYSGYRIELMDLKLANKTNEKANGSITIVNSGKYPVMLGDIGYRTSKLKVLFDTDLDQTTRDAIVTAVINSNMSLDPGDMKTNFAFVADIVNYKKQWTPSTAEKTPQVIPQAKKEEKVKIKEESNKKEVAPVIVDIIEEKPVSQKLTKTDCPDLIISALSIKKQTKRNLQIEYSLTNQGSVAAQIYDKKTKEYLALAAYFSASGKLSRGSLIAGGDIISKGLEQSGGALFPGETYTNTINIDLSTKSRYLNTLILSADSRQAVFECVENNNNKGIPID